MLDNHVQLRYNINRAWARGAAGRAGWSVTHPPKLYPDEWHSSATFFGCVAHVSSGWMAFEEFAKIVNRTLAR